MKEFILLFRGGDSRSAIQDPEQMQQHMQRWAKWMSDLGTAGKFVGAQPLDTTGRTLKGTKKVVTDGPFMEGKEVIGGYLVCKAADYNEAVEISKDCPILEFEDGAVEVREVQQMVMDDINAQKEKLQTAKSN